MRSIGWKFSAKRLLVKMPDNGESIKKVFRVCLLVVQTVRVKIVGFMNGSYVDPERVYWIDPDCVVYYTNYCKHGDLERFKREFSDRVKKQSFREQVFDRDKDKGKVYGGDWDESDYKFASTEAFKAIEQRILSGVEWEDTDFYKNVVKKIRSGEVLWRCQDEESFKRRCGYIDELIRSIRENGFRVNSDIAIKGDDVSSLAKNKKVSSEVTVNIGRSGEYLFQDGRHRLSIAKVLKIKKIPVKVLVRHKEWWELRENLREIMAEEGRGYGSELMMPRFHPDLEEFFWSEKGEEKILSIKNEIVECKGKVLDFGAGYGFLCHHLEEDGFTCCAMDPRPKVAWVAKKLRGSRGRSFEVVDGDALSFLDGEYGVGVDGFEVIISLGLLDCMIRDVSTRMAVKCWLEKIEVEVMFVEVNCVRRSELELGGASFEEDSVGFILSNSVLSRSDIVFRDEGGRCIYKLYK